MRVWEDFLKTLDMALGQEVVKHWLRSLKILRFDACNLYLEAADTFQSMWFEEHIRPNLKDRFRNPSGTPIKVHLSVANQAEGERGGRKKEGPEPPPLRPFELLFDQPDPHCRLTNFIPNEKNPLPLRLLSEMCRSVEEPEEEHPTPLGAFNPIYLYGASGTGKSHLLAALVHSLSACGLRCLYVRCETFTEHVIRAIRAGEMHTFRHAYRNIDVLLIDDIHELARKTATQEELFHTFNTLHTAGKQIVVGSLCAPGELQQVEPRLVSRFEWGIVLELTPLEGKTYQRLLEAKCEALQFPLTPRIYNFLLETFRGNAKNLIRALEALILRTHLSPSQNNASLSLTLNVHQIRQHLADLISAEQASVLTSDKIIHYVAEHYGIKVADITGKAQSRDCSLPRQLTAYLCRQWLKMPYAQIGEVLHRDHSTIMTCVKQIKKLLDSDNHEVAAAIRQIDNALKKPTQLITQP